MKTLDRIALAVFSVMMLIIAIVVCLVIFRWVDTTTMYMIMIHVLSDATTCNILLAINVIFILLAIKAIFFESGEKDDKYNDSVLLENDDGKLVITKETLIGIVDAVVDGFSSVKSSQTKVHLDENNNLSITLNVETTSDTIIKELSNNLQIRIKERIKESLDLEVKSVNIRIKSIVEPKTNTND
jgi:uncharacterized alkaline shock family protein YloU